jgi:DNA-binding PadR family transcriptional regulator
MTNAELTILTLMAERPLHGYEIEQLIEERGMREWTEVGFSSIYYLLKRLDAEGLVEGQLEEGGRGPARKVYRLTEAGWGALRAGVLEALATPRRANPHFLLGLSCLPILRAAEALTALEEYREALVARLAQLQHKWDGQRPLPSFVDAMFDYSVTLIRAQIGWVERYISRVEEESGQVRLQEGS